MWGVARKTRRRDVAPYAREVASALLQENFDPKVLDEMPTLGSFSKSSRIFQILADRELRPQQAAFAIQLAAFRYQDTRWFAEAEGWPVTNGHAVLKNEYPPNEAYFLELLDEAVDASRKFVR